VRRILEKYESTCEYLAPDSALAEAREKLPIILRLRKLPAPPGLELLELIAQGIQEIPLEQYEPREVAARARIGDRDPDDWPVVATALAVGSPIWTEDHDFFGCGVAVWRTELIEIHLTGSS
jgi:predicted nucleic acid-binding protein